MRLLTSTAFETAFGLRTLHIVHGSIAEADDPVIAVSSHANSGFSLDGSALDALSTAWHLDLATCELEALLVIAGAIGTYRIKCHAAQTVLVTRIPSALSTARLGGEPETVLRDAFWTLFGSLAALDLKRTEDESVKSMAMTKLGGARDHAPDELLRVLLGSVRRWLELSRSMNSVRLFIPELSEAESLAAQLDRILGRTSLEVAKSHVLVALIGDIVTDLPRIRNAALVPVANELATWLNPKQIVVSVVATVARKFVEAAVKALLADAKLKPSGDLAQQLQSLASAKVIAYWTSAYFTALRHFGNESVHERPADGPPPGRFGERDTVALLAALQRVVAIWLELEHRRPSLASR